MKIHVKMTFSQATSGASKPMYKMKATIWLKKKMKQMKMV